MKFISIFLIYFLLKSIFLPNFIQISRRASPVGGSPALLTSSNLSSFIAQQAPLADAIKLN